MSPAASFAAPSVVFAELMPRSTIGTSLVGERGPGRAPGIVQFFLHGHQVRSDGDPTRE
jgi:hypothetical protein